MTALLEKVDLIQGNIDLLTQGLNEGRKSVALSELKVRQDAVDLALAGLQRHHIVDLIAQYPAIDSIRVELQHLLTDIATKMPQTALVDIERKQDRIAQLTTMIDPLRARYTQIHSEIAEKITALDNIEAEIHGYELNPDTQPLRDKAVRMRETIATLNTALTGTRQKIDGLEALDAALAAKKQTLQASPQMILAPIKIHFFGDDHQPHTGRFHRYLEERKNTYFWKDFFAKFASLFLCCIGDKTEREKREGLVRDIKSALAAYEANPNPERLESIKAKIAQGIQFNKRVPNDHEHFSKTLASHLEEFSNQLAGIEQILHPQVTIAAAETEEPITPDPSVIPITPQA
jgi:chromosome segregation ATPase